MLPNQDIAYKKLSNNTLKRLENCFKNCNRHEISDYIFDILLDAQRNKEILESDIFRLGFKFLNQYLNEKG